MNVSVSCVNAKNILCLLWSWDQICRSSNYTHVEMFRHFCFRERLQNGRFFLRTNDVIGINYSFAHRSSTPTMFARYFLLALPLVAANVPDISFRCNPCNQPSFPVDDPQW